MRKSDKERELLLEAYYIKLEELVLEYLKAKDAYASLCRSVTSLPYERLRAKEHRDIRERELAKHVEDGP